MAPYSPYLTSYGSQRRKIKLLQRLDSSEIIKSFVRQYKGAFPDSSQSKGLRVTNESEAEYLLDMLNNPGSQCYPVLMNIQGMDGNWQTFGYVQSNLGHGFVFYFICNNCDRRTRHLYMPSGCSEFMCRICYQLKY